MDAASVAEARQNINKKIKFRIKKNNKKKRNIDKKKT
jgi:hypothetical protein